MIKIENKAGSPSRTLFADIRVGETFIWNGMLWMKLNERDTSDNVWCFDKNGLGYWKGGETVNYIVDCTLTVTNYK